MKKTLTSTLLISLCCWVSAQEIHNSEQILIKGNELQEKQKYKEAASLYTKIHESDSNYYRGLYEMSTCYYADSQFVKALEISTIGIASYSEQRPSFYNLHGNILDDMGQPEKAMLYYDTAIRIFPNYVSPYLNMATMLMRQKKYAEAETFLQNAAFAFPFSASLHYKLGVSALNQGKMIQGFLSLTHSLFLDPEGANNKNAVSILSSMSKGDEEMLEFYNKRTLEADANYQLVEEMFISRLAMDRKFKLQTELEDAITRQYQMIIEKLEYTQDNKDFYIQYYLPNLKEIHSTKKYDAYCNHMFSGLEIPQIKTFMKKNRKEVTNMVDNSVVYFNKIRVSREFFAHQRNTNGPWHYENGACVAKGKYENEKAQGTWEFFYVNGNTRSKGNFDADGKRTGEWIYYREDTRISGKDNYLAGELQGVDEEYHINGTLARNAKYIKGTKEGENHDYYATGNLKSIVIYDKGKESGTLKYYYAEGPQKTVINAKDGEINGKMLKYYLNGRVESESNYVNGKLDGKYKSFHDNGNLYAEGVYENDKQNSTWKFYHENGKLKSIQQFVVGETEGEQSEFHDNGQLSYKQVYRKGKADGETSYFNREGKLFSKLIFSNGRLKDAYYYDFTGKEISHNDARGKTFELDVFRPDGSKKSTARFDDKGISDGPETQFWSSGVVLSKMNYVEGKVEGEGVFFFNNGKKEQEINYSAGEKNGHFREYYKHGGLYAEGYYKENIQEGVWIYFDDFGNIRERMFYSGGEKDGIQETYYRNGLLEFREEYIEGSLMASTQYDTTGKVLVSHKWAKGTGKFDNRQLNGKVYAESDLLNGHLHGAYTSYFFDGKVYSKEFHYYGRSDSTYQVFFYNGKTQTEGKFYRGEKIGVWNYYNEDGSIYLKEEYVQGKLHGKRIFYNTAGKPEIETNYFHGRKDGWQSRFADDGLLVNKIRYNDDVMMEYSYEDKNGQLVKPISIAGGNGKVVSYFKNGNMSSKATYVDGDLNGELVYYHSNGKISWEAKEDFSLTEGPASGYYENGQAKEKFNYLHNDYHGQYQSFYPDGKIKKSGSYVMDMKHGEWTSYNKDGKAEEKSTYYYGRLLNIKKL